MSAVNDPTRKLLDSLLSQEDYVGFDSCLREVDDPDAYVLAGLVESASAERWAWFERYVISAATYPSTAMVSILSSVLDRRLGALNNEDIVSVLGIIGSSEAVPALYGAAMWNPDWDEFHGLAIKATNALAFIGTREALEALKDIEQLASQDVRDVAGS